MRLLRLGEHRIAKYVAPKERAAEPAVPHFANSAGEITREVLLTQIRDSIPDSADLKVTYSKPSEAVCRKPEIRAESVVLAGVLPTEADGEEKIGSGQRSNHSIAVPTTQSQWRSVRSI